MLPMSFPNRNFKVVGLLILILSAGLFFIYPFFQSVFISDSLSMFLAMSISLFTFFSILTVKIIKLQNYSFSKLSWISFSLIGSIVCNYVVIIIF